MKSRELKTIHNLIVSNYTMTPIGSFGKFLHTFTPETTNTVYSFEANGIPELEEGVHYNIGYYEDGDKRVIDISSTARADSVNPKFSYACAKQFAEEEKKSNKQKNDTRVKHSATDGYYWGKKYAWRQFGLAIPKDAFYKYLEEIKHPFVKCQTINPDLSFSMNEDSIAYKEEGLDYAIRELLFSAVKSTKVYFTSPHYSKKFSIRGPQSITDKK